MSASVAGGARNGARERSERGWLGHRVAVRRTTMMDAVGKTIQSGVRTASNRLDAGRIDANTTTARPRNASDRCVRMVRMVVETAIVARSVALS